MRLRKVETGHRLFERLKLWVVERVLGDRAPDVVRLLFYRPETFGKLASACLQAALRGPSVWSVGERELFAAFVSSRQRCLF